MPRVAACRVRDDTEVIVRAQVVDPGHRRVRAGDHVLAAIVVEVAVAHGVTLPVKLPLGHGQNDPGQPSAGFAVTPTRSGEPPPPRVPACTPARLHWSGSRRAGWGTSRT